MRKVLIALALCFVATNAWAVTVDLDIIAQIESGGCKAPCIGDMGKAYGKFQIHKGVVEDWNRFADISGEPYMKHKDMFDDEKAGIVAKWYLEKQIPAYLRMMLRTNEPITLEQTLTAWNMGIGSVKKGKVAREYVAKYRRIYDASR